MSLKDMQEYVLEEVVPIFESDEAKRYILERIKLDMGRKLYPILEQFQSPCVVEIDEKIIPLNNVQIAYLRGGGHLSSEFPSEKIRVTVRLYPVQHEHVVIYHAHLEEQIALKEFFLDKWYLKFRNWFMRGKR